MIKRLALAALALAIPFSAAAGPGEDSRDTWWIIAGSAPVGADVQTMRSFREMRSCGFRARVGLSDDLTGLRPGLAIVYLGPFPSRNGKDNVLEVVRQCIPDAYARFTAPNFANPYGEED